MLSTEDEVTFTSFSLQPCSVYEKLTQSGSLESFGSGDYNGNSVSKELLAGKYIFISFNVSVRPS